MSVGPGAANAADEQTAGDMAACDVRFGQVGIACVRVRKANAAMLYDELEHRARAAPQMFTRAAVVLDLSYLTTMPDDGTVDAMLEAVRSAGMLPVGLAYGTHETEALAGRMGLPLIAKFRAAFEHGAAATTAITPTSPVPASSALPAPASVPAPMLCQRHDQSVRSGQQIYARDRDLVITAAVANGAEVIADGSIHIYGALRGRALAGAQGDEDTRIFCTDFRAELISIADHYRIFEQLPAKLKGHSVQCWLNGEKLMVTRL